MKALKLQTGSYHYFALLEYVSFLHAQLRSYVPCRILLEQFSLGTRPHKSRTHNYVSTSAGEWSGHGRTSRTGSGAYAYTTSETGLLPTLSCILLLLRARHLV